MRYAYGPLCPIMVEVENGEITFLQGNPYASGIEGSICPRGAAGLALSQIICRGNKHRDIFLGDDDYELF
jgi:hypothetical protein